MTNLIGGFISINAVMTADSRDIVKIYFDKYRLETVKRSTYHIPEKKQYARITEFCAKKSIEIVYLTDDDFLTLTGGETFGGMAAEVGDRRYMDASVLLNKQNGYFVMLDGIEDPYNFGYVLRTFYAAGVDGVFLPERNFMSAASVVVRSSAGASELLDLAVYSDTEQVLNMLKEKSITIACTAKEEKASSLYGAKLSRPVCLVLGGEKRGINKKILSYADKILKIPYPREVTFSLSASSAASILSFEVARQLVYSEKNVEHRR